MNARIPQELSLAAYKRMDDAADAIEAENKRMAEQNAGVWIKDADFWTDELIDTEFQSLAMPLATCMKELDGAARGDVYSIGVILSMLTKIEKSAKPRAEKQLIDIYEAGE